MCLTFRNQNIFRLKTKTLQIKLFQNHTGNALMALLKVICWAFTATNSNGFPV